MDPDEFRAAAHAVVDLMADYLETVEARPVFPPIEPGSLAPLFPSAAPEDPEPLDAILADYRPAGRAERDPLAAPGLPGLLRDDGVRARDPRRDADRGARPEPDAVADVADRHRARGGRRRLAAPGARPARRRSTACSPTRPRRRRSSRSPPRARRPGSTRRPRARRPAGRAGAARLRLGRGPQLDREGVHDARARAGGAGPDPGRRRASRCAPTPLAAAIAADRAAGRRPIAIVATVGTTSSTSVDPVAAIADIAEREGLWLHVDAAYAGAVALLPERAGAVRRLGARRFDRRQPAQVAVHAARRVAAADAPDGPAARRRSASCPSTCGRSTATRRSATTTSTRPQLGRRFRALKLWIQLRWFGLEGLRRRIERTPRAGRSAFAGWVDADPDWERLAPVPFSTVCFRWRPGALAGRRRAGGRRALDARTPRSWTRSTAPARSFLSHTRLDGRFTIRVAIGNLRTRGAPRRARLGAAPRGRGDGRGDTALP